MFHRLKKKFTILATASMFLLMVVLVLIMNIVNYSSVIVECDTILNVLSQPNAPFFEDTSLPGMENIRMDDFIPSGMSPEVPYESRYFTVMVSPDGEVSEPDFSRIISVDSNSAEDYITQALNSKSNRGFIGDFRYYKVSDNRVTRILFLDCGRKLDFFHTFLWISVAVGFFGCLATFVVFLFASGRIVKPIAESYEKQKRFISDAGHEIKTPLTIINANVDLLDEGDGQEELAEIRQQTKHLTELTNSLVLLSKMEEDSPAMQKIEIPLSDIVLEAAAAFRAPAVANKIRYTVEVQPKLEVLGSPDEIRRLVSILVDNAMKYAPLGGDVKLTLETVKKSVVLTIANTTAEAVNEQELPFVFDRFYRTDASRNSATGGHGIGLSVAKAIVEAHDGTISAATRTGMDFTVTAVLPL